MKKSMIVFCILFFTRGAFAVTFPEDRVYQYNICGSERAGQEYRRINPVVNCYQYGNFSTDGDVFLLFTDVPNVGKYSLEENKIHVVFAIHHDAPQEMEFLLSEDQRSATNLLDGRIWNLK